MRGSFLPTPRIDMVSSSETWLMAIFTSRFVDHVLDEPGNYLRSSHREAQGVIIVQVEVYN
jgi:hypothetical protein